jgi:hypothetical protein
MKARQSSASLITAIVLLLLPVLYVGSYLALVQPTTIQLSVSFTPQPIQMRVARYRLGDSVSERIFWPLEQIDRKVRPGAWKST